MPSKRDSTLGWGTIGFWFGAMALFFAVLLFGVLIPSGTRQVTQTERTQPAEPAQPQQPPGPAR